MATRARTTARAFAHASTPHQPAATFGHPGPESRDGYFDPASCPEIYACTAQGTCLEPVYQDGVCFVISATERPRVGDYVVIYFRPEVVPPGNVPRMVKQLAMGLPEGLTFPVRFGPNNALVPLLVVEQHNPRKCYSIPVDHVIALHKVIGTGESTGDGMARWRPAGEA